MYFEAQLIPPHTPSKTGFHNGIIAFRALHLPPTATQKDKGNNPIDFNGIGIDFFVGSVLGCYRTSVNVMPPERCIGFFGQEH